MPWITRNGAHVLIGEDGQPVTPTGQGGQHTQKSWEAAVKGNPAHKAAIDTWTSPMGASGIRAEERSGNHGPVTQAFHEALAAAPNHEGIVYRGISAGPHDTFLYGLNPGATVTMGATASASKDLLTAKGAAGQKEEGVTRTILSVAVKTGVNISNLSSKPGEREVLLRQGSKYKVEDAQHRGGFFHVKLREV